MAKEKKEETKEVKESKTSPLDLVQKALKGRFADMKKVLKTGVDLIEEVRRIVPVSPTLNLALGGGILEGTWNIISGNPKIGKTATALQIAANAQAMGKQVYYLAVEGRLKKRDLEGIHGLNPEKMIIIGSEEGTILKAEDYLNAAMDIIKSDPGCVIILDSASALCTEDEFTKELTATGRNNGPKLLASFCRQMGNVVPIQKTIVIIIQHLIANTSGYGPAYNEDGGRKIFYQVDNKIRPKTVSKWEDGEKQIGNIIQWDVITSAMSAPNLAGESYFRFGHGLDEEMELLMVAQQLGLISKAGAWYKLDWLLEDLEKLKKQCKVEDKDCPRETLEKIVKFQGQEKTRVFLVENPEIKEDLYKRVSELL